MTKISAGAIHAADPIQENAGQPASAADIAGARPRSPSRRASSDHASVDASLHKLRRTSTASRTESPAGARRPRATLPESISPHDAAIAVTTTPPTSARNSLSGPTAGSITSHAAMEGTRDVSHTDDTASVSSQASVEDLSHVKPTPTYQGVIPAAGAPWSKGQAQVEQAWRAISNKQQTLRLELQSGNVDAARAAQIRQCLAVDLASVAPGTAVALAPQGDIKEQYQAFRAALQIQNATLKDGALIEISANPTMPTLLRTLTEGNVFPHDAKVGELHPYAFLSGLTQLHAPNDAALSATMAHLMHEMPKLQADLGAVSLMHMEQQVSRDWQSYITWIASAGWAAGMGYLAGPQEKSVRKDLHLAPEQTQLSGRQAFILGAADASTSGNSEAGDALLIDGLDKLSHNESPAPDADAPANMTKAWLIGTITALPSSYLTYANISKTAKIIAGLPANLLAAIGGAAPLPMTRQKRNDHNLAAYVESISNGMQNEMSAKKVGELIDASERVATMGQLLQKGVAWSFAGGFITWAIQSGHSQGQIVSTMQRLLLNPMEAHALMGGGLLGEYVSVLGATRAEKNANLATRVSANAAENKDTSMDEIIAIHEPKVEKYIQGFGRGAGDAINALINGAEDGTRWAARKVGLPVKEHMRHRIDYERVGGGTGADALEQVSTRRGADDRGFGQAAGSIPLSERDQTIDVERNERDFRPAV
ncbi:hypothetical protein [Robbsia sp. KACC 23696]|uniref:hypothetical protein n=1 Tax=Robbsia sp. KACC 23696 TaxID=3149231 RepID=UPI00325ABEFC